MLVCILYSRLLPTVLFCVEITMCGPASGYFRFVNVRPEPEWGREGSEILFMVAATPRGIRRWSCCGGCGCGGDGGDGSDTPRHPRSHKTGRNNFDEFCGRKVYLFTRIILPPTFAFFDHHNRSFCYHSVKLQAAC